VAVYRRTTRTRYVLAVLVLAAVTLVTIDSRSNGGGVLRHVRAAAHDVFSPLQRGTHAVLEPIGNFLSGAVHYGSLRTENQRLRDQLAGLEAQGVQSSVLQQEAQQVLGLQHLSFVGQIPTRTAQVIDQGSSNFSASLTIDRGTHAGLAVGQPVVAAGGLVGTISQVSATTATVSVLTDPSFVVGVRLDAANVGTASGTGPVGPLHVTVITTDQPTPNMTPGEVISTSGLQLEQFPAGIPVGKVTTVGHRASGIEPDISLAPMVDTATLSYVDVLLWSPQTP
jgi:rod shape-determining protein MreC